MRYLIPLLLCIPMLTTAQTQKGVTPLAPSTVYRPPSTVRAVVVGISDYQSPAIPDLQYADTDAEVFAQWLESPAGGTVPKENVILLTNAKATNGQISTALYWLLDESKEGDIAIFYFSGHGDVEAKIRSQIGFLLAHDSPPTNYIGSALNLRDVQDIVSTLSIEKKSRVVLITDACHAGKLAGTAINGTQATAQALAQQFANEVKIMSCQPNEFSLEGKQWGNGRGVFSWILLDGLTGLADKNGDGAVNLFEIGRYLEDNVPAETAPHPQMPMTVGERQTTVSQVNAEALAMLLAQKQGQSSTLLATKSKGFAEGFFDPGDSAAQKLYADFQAALDAGNLFHPKGRSALDYFNQLDEKQEIKPMQGLMKRNLAAALIDEVQQALNALLDNDPYETNNWKFNPAKYRDYPEYLQQAMDLLGEKHIMRRSLLAKKFYFEGYNLAKNLGDYQNRIASRDSIKALAKAKYLESLRIEPGAAYVYYAVGNLYYLQSPIQTDSLLTWMQKAVDRSPSWLIPYLDAAEEINSSLNDMERAEPWLVKAQQWHPTSYILMIRLAWLRQWQGNPEEANAICRDLIEQRPDLPDAWFTMSVTQYWLLNDYLEAYKLAQHGMELNTKAYTFAAPAIDLSKIQPREAILFIIKHLSEDTLNLVTKGDLIWPLLVSFVHLRRFDEAEKWFQVQEKEKTGYAFSQALIQNEKGRMRILQNRFEAAEKELQKALETDGPRSPANIQSYALLGESKNRLGKFSEAETYFKKAIEFVNLFQQNAFKNEAYFLYGRFLVYQNRLDEAQIQFDNALKISPKTWHHPMGMALLAAKNRQKTLALDWLEKALDRFYFDETGLMEEPLFSKIKKSRRFKALMMKHFPETQIQQN